MQSDKDWIDSSLSLSPHRGIEAIRKFQGRLQALQVGCGKLAPARTRAGIAGLNLQLEEEFEVDVAFVGPCLTVCDLCIEECSA